MVRSFRFVLLCGLVSLFGCNGQRDIADPRMNGAQLPEAPEKPPEKPSGPTYRFGVVPQFEATQLAAIWIPILSELGERTGYSFQLAGSPRIPEFEAAFLNLEFDFAYMNPYHCIRARSAGYKPMIRDHGRTLSGILVVSADSDIQNVKDLEGKTIAFPAPNALGASLLMRAELTNKFGIEFKPKYVNTHSSVYLNVMLGEADAGGGVMSTLKKHQEKRPDRLRVIYETEKLPPHPIVRHPDVSDEVAERISRAFLEMAESEEGRALLARIPMIEPGPATAGDYDMLVGLKLESFYEASER